MNDLYLIKIGEIKLKEGNRKYFLNKLKENILDKTRRVPETRVSIHDNRLFLKIPEGHAALAETVLASTPGINGWAKTHRTAIDFSAVTEEALRIAASFKPGTFKVEARRSDKSYPMTSYEIAAGLGERILDARSDLRVDVHTPDSILFVEIRDAAYLYTNPSRSVRGLPTGTAGKGLLLLSGGIDSPIAGYMMALRGLALEAVHFAAYPYTSRESWDKVKRLAMKLTPYTGTLVLHTLQFTDLQLAIKKNSAPECATIYLRAAMVEAAHLLARELGCNSLVTGESLSQVASQTAENIRFTQHTSDLPILRPLVGFDKEDTIKTARAIGTFDISIEPFEDCCVLFSPKHPVLKAKFEEEKLSYKKLDLAPLIEEAVEKRETIRLEFDP